MPNEEGVTLRTITEVPPTIPAEEPPPGAPIDRSVADALRLIGIPPTGPVIEPIPDEPPADPSETPTPEPVPTPETPTPSPTPETPPPAPAPATPPAKSGLSKVTEKLDAIADRLARAGDPTPAAPAPTPEPEPESLRVQALKLLETDPKSKYRGQNLVQKYGEYETKWNAYKTKWEVDHPDAEFDPDDEAHDTFRDRYEPDIAETDIVRAEARIEARRDAEEALAAQRAELAQERIRENAKAAARNATSLLTDKPIDKVEEEDPALADAIEEAVPAAQRLAKLAHEMFTPGTNTRWDLANPEHKTLLALVGDAEDNLAAQPAESVTYEGRRFVPAKVWSRMSQAERENAWTPAQEPGVVEILLKNHLRAGIEMKAGKLREKYAKRATKYGTPAPAAPTPAVPAPTPAATPPAGGTGLQAPVTVPGTGGDTGLNINHFFGG